LRKGKGKEKEESSDESSVVDVKEIVSGRLVSTEEDDKTISHETTIIGTVSLQINVVINSLARIIAIAKSTKKNKLDAAEM